MSFPVDVSDDLRLEAAIVNRTLDVRARPRSIPLVALFSTTLFVSAFLMFLVEPMMARMVLPLLGGAPAVWNTCLVFFQAVLLGGYAYAHGATGWLGLRRHIAVHSVLLLTPLLVLPIALHQPPPLPGQNPMAWLLLVLTASVGLPFFVVSTSAAVLQKWFSATDDESARDPYFLYVASNLGSFIALLAYPVIVEPTLRLQDQSRLWTVGYGALVVLSLACAMIVWRRGGESRDGQVPDRAQRVTGAAADAPISWARRGRWLALAFVPSSLLLAVTNYISTDVASVPLLWVVPLALYLLAFAVAFSPSAAGVRAIAANLMPLLVLTLTLVLAAEMQEPLRLVIRVHLIAFLAIAIVCHGDLADDRPSPTQLTEFYFWIALGGMLGGLFNALLAPVLFVGIVEYPIMIVAACLLRSVPRSDHARTPNVGDVAIPLAVGGAIAASALVNNHFGSLSRYLLLGAAVPALVVLSQKQHRVRFAASIAMILLAATLTEGGFGHVVYAARTFFGVYRVRVDEARGYRFMVHGTTLHGMQRLDPARSDEPLSYFHRTGPIGQIFAALPRASTASDVAVIGLGVGTLASYRAPSQHWTFYEIDPIVERIARNAGYFTYLSRCGADCTVITGDGRVSLARETPQKFGVIVLDAFSSDAIPIHLLTKEAMALYLSRLAPGGAIVFHISNMNLSLSHVLARVADDAGLQAVWQHEPPDAGSWQVGKFPSEWLVVARDRRDFGRLTSDVRWKAPEMPDATPLWTDDFSNILSVLKRSGD
jgi:hypothetical protein